jgi:repressor LexA
MDDREIDCPYCVKPEASCECRWFPENQPALPVLTPKQALILLFIEKSTRERGYAPSFHDIGAEFGFAGRSGAVEHLGAIEKKGYIRRQRNAKRAIEVLALPQ